MSGRPVPIGTLDTPPDEVARAALERVRQKGRGKLYLVLLDGHWLAGAEHARFVAEADVVRGKLVCALIKSTPAEEIERAVEAARA